MAAFGLSLWQASLNAGLGSDHAVHAFLVRAIRRNRFRLFTRIPNILNETHCAALPLYLHSIVARFGSSAIPRASLLLNPVVNGLHVVLVAWIAWTVVAETGTDFGYVAVAAWIFALTPQFYHALSARNFGLSARGIGVLLLTLFLFAGHMAASGPNAWGWWAALIVSAYLVWAFSTFGAQAMVIISVLMAVLFGSATPLLGLALGLCLFIAVHPRYSIGYLKHTLSFIHTYGTSLAAVYILPRRFSIWRDLVWDIWQRIFRSRIAGLRYAYENSILIISVLNPATIAAIVLWASGRVSMVQIAGLPGYASHVAVCGVVAFLLTSFRPTRFLGEPERYVEATTPWAAVASGLFLMSQFGLPGLLLVLAALLAMDLFQFAASRMLQRHVAKNPMGYAAVQQAIVAAADGPVRCAGNNEQFTRHMLEMDWSFVFCMALEKTHCGLPIAEAFTEYPFIRRESLQKIVRHYRANFCVLDRKIYDDIYDEQPADLLASHTVHLSPDVRVLRLDWATDTASAHSSSDLA